MAKKVKKKVPQRKPKTSFYKRRNVKNNPALNGGRGMGTGAGNPKKIETPEDLYELFKDFKQWCKDNPYQKVAGVSNGIPIFVDHPRALVFRAFEGHLSELRIVFDLSHYERDEVYRPIIAQIKSECSKDSIQGAMAGVHNANLTARLEKISENVDQTTGGKAISTSPTINVYNKTPKLNSSEDEVDT